MRNCNQFYFFSLKKCFKSVERTAKRGGFRAFPSKLFFQKNWPQNHIFTHCRSSHREVFCKKGALRNLAKFTEKYLWQSLFEVSIKLQALLKKRLWRRCFPVNFAKFQRTPFLIEHLRWLILTLEFLKIIFSSMGSPNLQL